jgi:hypothetical protein
MIPNILQNRDYRFIKVVGKAAIEKGFTSEKNYLFDSPELANHLANLDNGYGVLAGFGGLVLVDADSKELCGVLNALLPPTFTVKTGKAFVSEGSGRHYYFRCPEWIDNMVLGPEGQHGHIQAKNKFLVGPGSPHYKYDEKTKDKTKSGYTYEVEKDLPITTITVEQLKKAISPFITQKNKPEETTTPTLRIHKTYAGELQINEVISLSGLRQINDSGEYQGPHPTHGSSTGANFTINTSKNTYYCFRHGCGGGPLYSPK